jgi:uncharacterized membrane protein YsdA (DUF1294 family)/cold shock CspA family protein
LKFIAREGMERMEREQGTLIHWDDDKGYGFLRSNNGKKETFLHIKSLPHYQRRPQIGDVLKYEVEVDENERPIASSAKIKGLAWSHFTFTWVFLSLLFGTYMYLAFRQILPFHPLLIYVAVSLLTILAYSRDKRAAQRRLRRTPENRLHLLEALGGWPGALLAQIFYRHKGQKRSYQIVFWLIVAGHGLLWYILLTHQEKYLPYQEVAIEKIQSLTHNVKRETQRLLEPEKPESVSLTKIPATSIKQGTGFHSPKRSIITPSRQALIAEGIVKEIRPGEGVSVSLQTGTEGMIPKATLVSNFSSRFTKGEHIRVSIHTISSDGKNPIEFVLVE